MDFSALKYCCCSGRWPDKDHILGFLCSRRYQEKLCQRALNKALASIVLKLNKTIMVKVELLLMLILLKYYAGLGQIPLSICFVSHLWIIWNKKLKKRKVNCWWPVGQLDRWPCHKTKYTCLIVWTHLGKTYYTCVTVWCLSQCNNI